MLNEINKMVDDLLLQKKTVIMAIDGDCASGKTTLAEMLAEEYSCNVFHTDDFYLPISERNNNYSILPDGNVDYDRLIQDVIKPIKSENTISYRKYNCHDNLYSDLIFVDKKPLNIIEGSYSMHPKLEQFYDCSVFLLISSELQSQRLKRRNLNNYDSFIETWIPMEKRYAEEYSILKKCTKTYFVK